MRDFTIHLPHHPGELAEVANALSFSDVNIKSVAAMHFGNEACVRIIPDDAEAARNALRDKNIRFEENEVASVLVENKAGELTGLSAKLAEAGLNLEALYVVGLAGDLIELVVATDNAKKAKKVLADMAS